MAKFKKGAKVRVHGRTCTVQSANGSVTCGPPAGKKKRGRKGSKRKGVHGIGALSKKRRSGKRRGGGRSTCGIPAGLLNRLPTSAADQLKTACLNAQGGIDALLAKVAKGEKKAASTTDKAAMHAARKLLAEQSKYTKAVMRDEKNTRRAEELSRFYAQEAARPKAGKKKRSKTVYSRADPRFNPNLAGVRRRR